VSENRNEEKLSERIKKQRDFREEDRNELDEFVDQKFADDIPLEDLKIDAEQEKNKHKSQNTSQSEEKYDEDLWGFDSIKEFRKQFYI